MPKRSRSGDVSRPARVVAPTSVNGGRSSLMERAAGPFADHDIELEVFHGRVQHFLDHRAQPVDLVDEQHVAGLEAGQHRGEIARTLQHRAGRVAQVDAQLVGQDVRQRGLAQARRAEDQGVVERLAPLPGRGDEDVQLPLHGRLAHVVGQALRTDRAVELVVAQRTRRRPAFRPRPCSALRRGPQHGPEQFLGGRHRLRHPVEHAPGLRRLVAQGNQRIERLRRGDPTAPPRGRRRPSRRPGRGAGPGRASR